LNEIFIEKLEECKKNIVKSQIIEIKATEKILAQSGNFYIIPLHNFEPKVVMAAMNEMINEDKEKGFVSVISYETKVQYILLCSKTSKFDCKENISKINSLVLGSGGGTQLSAQGGVNKPGVATEIIDFLKTF
jgi:alanyl-tRNA synthetase